MGGRCKKVKFDNADSNMAEIDEVSILGLDVGGTTTTNVKKSDRFATLKHLRRLNNSSNKNSLNIEIPTPFDDISDTIDGSSKKTGLNFKQRKAIRLLAVFGYDIGDVAKQLGVTVKTVKLWMGKKEFIKELFSTERFLTAGAIEYRLNMNNEIVNQLYDELNVRIHRGDLSGMSFKDIAELLWKFSNESRLDDKNAATQKVESHHVVEFDLKHMQERFNMHRVRHELYNKFQMSDTRMLNAPSESKIIDAELEHEPATKSSARR